MNSKRITGIIAVLLLLVPATTIAAGLSARPADLAIDQPRYADKKWTRTSADQTPVYHVHGDSVEISPQNFQASNVVDYGVRERSAQLSYSDSFGEYELTYNATGSYHVYWVVTRSVQVQQNNTTTTRNVTVRYEAIIRCESECNLVHRDPASLKNQRQNAERMRKIINRLHELGLVNGRQIDVVLREMVNTYYLIKRPFAALAGGFSQVIILIASTMGGRIFGGLVLTAFGTLAYVLYARLWRHEAVEKEEGELTQRIAEFEFEKRKQKLANKDANDVMPDFWASVFEDVFDSKSPLDIHEQLTALFTPSVLVRDRLKAMHSEGYRALVTRDATEQVTRAEILEPDDVDDVEDDELSAGESVESIDEVSDEVLYELDWDDGPVGDVDITEMDTDHEMEYDVADYETLVERFERDLHHVSDEQYVEYLKELVDDVRHHPYTDPDGYDRPYRASLNRLLDVEQRFADRFEMPMSEYIAQALEKALDGHDPAKAADRDIDTIQSGQYDA